MRARSPFSLDQRETSPALRPADVFRQAALQFRARRAVNLRPAIAIATGHHGTARAGELVLFDVAKGRHQAAGAVQRIPGRGKPVEAVMVDNLVDASWPKFLHPFPLSDKYFLVASRPNAESRWGIYLVDVFDNMLLLREEEGCVLFEPIPVRPSPCSPFPFPPAYYELRRLVRSPGLEGPSVIPVADYHADTNGLVQMLRKGHHGVRLDNGSSTWAFALSAGPISTRPVEAVRAGQKEPSRLGAGRRSVMRIQHRPSGPARRWIRIWRRTGTRTRLELTNVEC